MATATEKREVRLSDEDTAKVMALIKDSDSVELKLTIPETEHSSTVAALKIDPSMPRSVRCSSSTRPT